ncbi:TetR/AcrR family transcriptional regulator [Embleya sp. NBC_00888]|uniref:TetR/AcrR family transcriptional regulator n=1 Tax=Embleya sp. NBC_00888 TaxID=2975960 RepID=UPI003866F66E|nr:TetR/AcrR family transcriptional regulator [Embleya sp. NBC_00888]
MARTPRTGPRATPGPPAADPGAEMPDLPTPPWRRGRAKPVRPPLSRASIVRAALAVLDEGGLEAVSMRRVADELDTGPASLYVHVSSKEELLELVLDHVLGDVVIPVPDPDRWQAQLKEVALGFRAVLAAHNDLGRAVLAAIPSGPNALRISEGLLAVMRSGGVPEQASAWVLDVLQLYISADVYEGALHLSRSEAGEDPMAMAQAYLGEVIEALPRDRFPTLTALKPHMISGGRMDRVEFGLDIFIRGLADIPRP